MNDIKQKASTRNQLIELAGKAAEIIITHGGEHPQHVKEVTDKMVEFAKEHNLPPTSETFLAMFYGAKLHNDMVEDEDSNDNTSAKTLGVFLLASRNVKKQTTTTSPKAVAKKVPVVSKSTATKVNITKPVTPKQ